MAFQGSEILAQVTPTDTNLYRVVKYNNQEYIGRILNDDGREVLPTKRYSFPVPMCTWFYKF